MPKLLNKQEAAGYLRITEFDLDEIIVFGALAPWDNVSGTDMFSEAHLSQIRDKRNAREYSVPRALLPATNPIQEFDIEVETATNKRYEDALSVLKKRHKRLQKEVIALTIAIEEIETRL